MVGTSPPERGRDSMCSVAGNNDNTQDKNPLRQKGGETKRILTEGIPGKGEKLVRLAPAKTS